MTLAATLICTQTSKIPLESGSGKIQRIETTAPLRLLGLSWELPWSDALCRVGINVGRRLQSHAHDGISHSEKCSWPASPFFFSLSFPLQAECRLNIRVFCLFSQHVVWKRVTRGSARWEKLWNQGQNWSELGGPGLSAATCILLNCLLVQQEMSNNNKLGKVKAK